MPLCNYAWRFIGVWFMDDNIILLLPACPTVMSIVLLASKICFWIILECLYSKYRSKCGSCDLQSCVGRAPIAHTMQMVNAFARKYQYNGYMTRIVKMNPSACPVVGPREDMGLSLKKSFHCKRFSFILSLLQYGRWYIKTKTENNVKIYLPFRPDQYVWNFQFVLKLPRRNRWNLGMYKWFHPAFHLLYGYLSMLGLKLNHVGQSGHWYTCGDWGIFIIACS